MFLWGSDNNIACMTLWFFPFQNDTTNRKSHFANVSRKDDDLRAGLSMQLTHVPMKRSPWPSAAGAGLFAFLQSSPALDAFPSFLIRPEGHS